MDRNIEKSLSLIFGSEGGYVNRKTDSGGPTKYGITHRTLAASRGVSSVTAEEVKALTRKEAAEIYRKSYWVQSGSHLLPDGLDFMSFDFGVNSGPSRSVRSLQSVLGVKEDGIVGAFTLDAVAKYKGGISKLLKDYTDERMRYLRTLGGPTGFGPNGRGWTIRVTGVDPDGKWARSKGVIGHALDMVNSIDSPSPPSLSPTDGTAKGNEKDTKIIEVIKKPEAWGPLGGLLSAMGALFSGSGPIQYALAFGIVAGVAVGLYYFTKRIRGK